MAGSGSKVTDGGLRAALERRRWEELVVGRRPVVLRYLVRRTGDWEEAEDLCGEVMERALAVDAPPSAADATRWLLTVAEGLLRRRRKQRARPSEHPGRPISFESPVQGSDLTVGETLAGGTTPVPEQVEQRDLLVRLLRGLRRLPPSERALLWRRLGGASLEELAAEWGISRHAVHRQLARARTRLLASLPEELRGDLRRRLGARR